MQTPVNGAKHDHTPADCGSCQHFTAGFYGPEGFAVSRSERDHITIAGTNNEHAVADSGPGSQWQLSFHDPQPFTGLQVVGNNLAIVRGCKDNLPLANRPEPQLQMFSITAKFPGP